MKKSLQKAAAILVIIAGLLLLFYPWISNYLYEHSVDSTVNVYEQEVDEISNTEIDQLISDARRYNDELSQSQVMLTDPFLQEEDDSASDTEKLEYENLLSADDTGIMCFVEIPKIDVYLPVYHGTSTEVLEKGIGHIEGSSLPIGGIGTHAVLSGHTGVNSAKLFTDLTEMEEGDLFFLHVLGETLAYRVDRVLVIEPEDTSSLVIDPDRDLVSLLTCTPYGVNTHRLVVTGERTEYTPTVYEEAQTESSDSGSLWMSSYRKAILIGLAIVAAIAVVWTLIRKIWQNMQTKGRRTQP